jgi:UDP-glucose 4-epimerase
MKIGDVMTILVTGSAGHLGEGLMRTLREAGRPAIGIDLKESPFTDQVCSITDRTLLRKLMPGIRQVIHTAALHKPHIVTNSRQEFVDTNITGTLALLDCAGDADVESFVFTSTTSAFGSSLSPKLGMPSAWITEDVSPVPKNIYGATKLAAEHLCEMIARSGKLPTIILRTSRFFPEEDDSPDIRDHFTIENAQVNELLYRRVDLEDAVSAHLIAADKASSIGFGRYLISAPTPFQESDLMTLRNAPFDVVGRIFPQCESIYASQGWRLFPDLDRVYVSRRAMRDLGWRPKWDFRVALKCVEDGQDFRSPLALAVGRKGYHGTFFENGPYPIEAEPAQRTGRLE